MFFYLKVIDYFKITWIPRMFKAVSASSCTYKCDTHVMLYFRPCKDSVYQL